MEVMWSASRTITFLERFHLSRECSVLVEGLRAVVVVVGKRYSRCSGVVAALDSDGDTPGGRVVFILVFWF